MRPPQFAGEDHHYPTRRTNTTSRFNEAPAVRGGRWLGLVETAPPVPGASMRPPQFAGEDCWNWRRMRRSICSFNEAPAVRGGRSGAVQDNRVFHAGFNEAPAVRGGRCGVRHRPDVGDGEASMRPPQFAGEDGGGWPPPPRRSGSFNEAPAVRGGRSTTRPPGGLTFRGFNEAPAVRGGRSSGRWA